jgi:hypothetical protein
MKVRVIPIGVDRWIIQNILSVTFIVLRSAQEFLMKSLGTVMLSPSMSMKINLACLSKQSCYLHKYQNDKEGQVDKILYSIQRNTNCMDVDLKQK